MTLRGAEKEWFGVWKAQMREATRHIWNGDVEAGVELLERVVSAMKKYRDTQRGGTV